LHKDAIGFTKFNPYRERRALFVAPQILSTDHGGGIRVFEEARALSLHGSHNVSIYSYSVGEPPKDWLPHSMSLNRTWFTPPVFPAGPTLNRVQMDIQLALRSIGSLRCRSDVVHVHAHEGVPTGKILSSK
jgi:hypothetical protein